MLLELRDPEISHGGLPTDKHSLVIGPCSSLLTFLRDDLSVSYFVGNSRCFDCEICDYFMCLLCHPMYFLLIEFTMKGKERL